MKGREIIIIDGIERYVGRVVEADQSIGYKIVKNENENIIVAHVMATEPGWNGKWKTFESHIEKGQFKKE